MINTMYKHFNVKYKYFKLCPLFISFSVIIYSCKSIQFLLASLIINELPLFCDVPFEEKRHTKYINYKRNAPRYSISYKFSSLFVIKEN